MLRNKENKAYFVNCVREAWWVILQRKNRELVRKDGGIDLYVLPEFEALTFLSLGCVSLGKSASRWKS